ncbi:MAG: HAMP domain-containing histidine kinase [Propionibacteriaceae bacterium]|nr:HAMP domain-containing histidine kinase [Propionibacteriaceae bacterium]
MTSHDSTLARRPGARPPGWSVRLKLTLSYAGLLVVAGALLLAVVLVFLLRYVPAEAVYVPVATSGGERGDLPQLFFPGRGDLWAAFAPKAAVAMAALLGFGLAGGWILAGRMLAPVQTITAATRLAAAGSLSHRIDLPGGQDEFRELADAFDAMLARLEAHVAEQQRFAANASHELRTPLAISQSLLDVARQDPSRDADLLIDRLEAVNARAIAVTEALLLLSRAGQRAFTAEPVDLSLVAEEAAETLIPLAERHGVTVEVSGGAATAAGSRALLDQVAVNLLHNAIVHNRPHGAVHVATAADGDTATLTVENTGAAIDPALVATLTEPFQRGGDRARSDHAGVGLGLAIVDRIVQAHDGTLTLTPRDGGGLTVVVRLNAPADPGRP